MKIYIESIFKSNRMKYSIVVLFISMSLCLQAQNPNWTVNENNYEHTMTFVAFLNIDGTELSSTNDELAVFVGTEIRGVTNLVYVSSVDRYLAYLTAFSNTNAETLSFKVYDSQNDNVRDITTTEIFQINSHIGDVFQAVSVSDPVLSNSADILTFEFDGVVAVDNVLSDGVITIAVDQSQDVTALTPVFTTSEGSQLFLGTIEQISGSTNQNFTNTITYRVRSEDNSVLKDWTIIVNRVDTDLQYFRKDATCYENGAIRIETTESFTVPVQIFFNNNQLASQPFVNGEVIFTGLDANTYQIRIGSIVKNIEVDLRTN